MSCGILVSRALTVKRGRRHDRPFARETRTMRIDIVSDVICPWCFIGKRRLERAMAMRPELEVRRRWRPFQLNPDMPADGMPRERYLAAKFGAERNSARIYANVAAAGKGEGIDFAFDRIRRTPNTVRAHRLIRLAAEEGIEDSVVEALFGAYFLDGRDIGDVETLTEIAARCGLDEAATRTHLAGPAGASEVRAEDQRARRLGIDAVPCFIIDGGYAIAGAQAPEMFLPLFDVATAAALHPEDAERAIAPG
jgi:predicted DsbA family dithiol-disulfide isomerase